MKFGALAAAIAVLAAWPLAGGLSAAHAQAGAITPPGDGPLDISSDSQEVFERESRIVYTGDVNALRGNARLRADRIEVYFVPRQSGTGFGEIDHIVAVGEVYYITPTEVVRGNQGTYDLQENTIVLTGQVVLTQGCNVSTGERLTANLDTGVSELAGSSERGDRVRSVFFPEAENEAEAAQAQDCPRPEIPGDGPQEFDSE